MLLNRNRTIRNLSAFLLLFILFSTISFFGKPFYIGKKSLNQEKLLYSNNDSTKRRASQLLEERRTAGDRILVKYKKPATKMTIQSIEMKYNIQTIRYFDFIDVYLYKVPEPQIDIELIAKLKKEPLIEYAEPDYIISIAKTPNDPRFSELWALHNIGQTGGAVDSDIDAPEAWDFTTGSSNVIVAVIDSGVDYKHEDLKDNMWENQNETPGNGLDDDGNGYIDDIYGIDAITNTGDPMDYHGHGTLVAGTIAAVGDNGKGVVGVCWKAKIMALKFSGKDGAGVVSDAIECIKYAIKKGSHIINVSWGGTTFCQALKDAIDASKNAGILFVAACGNQSSNNDSRPFYPASYDCENIISVAATDDNDDLASFSNYGYASVDVAAPGFSITSTSINNSYSGYGGTSAAAPYVSGLAALIKSYNFNLNWKQIKDRILNGVDKKDSLSGKVLTGGRINAFNSLISQDTYNYTLSIKSSPWTGASIEISPADINGQGNGITDFERIYPSYTNVTCTAPQTLNGRNFGYWALDGVRYSDNRTISISLDYNHI
jgi:subtilisin family serine protease